MSNEVISPSKPGWVQFGDDEQQVDKGNEATRSPNHSSSSGISSARGSVNSVTDLKHSSEPLGASLPVSEVQVVDELTLRKKSSALHASNMKYENSNNSNKSSSNNSSRKTSVSNPNDSSRMDNVNLGDDSTHPIEQQQPAAIRGRHFDNGEVIVTLLPVNERFPWVTPAKFRPELVPEELMAPILTLTVEDYVQTMEKLTTDMRFTVYNIFYKRILIFWIVTAFTILLSLLFSGFEGVRLFVCGVVWLVMNAGAIFFCMWIKLRLNKQLERCMSSINSGLLKHKIILAIDDRGKLSCHKVNLCFIYFEPKECIKRLEAVLAEKPDESTQNGEIFDREAYLRDVEEFEDVEVVVSGRNSVKIDRKAERAEKLYLHYVQRWAKDYLRRRLDWIVEDVYGRTDYASNTNPRHLRTALCPCQYIEEHLRNKRHRESLNPCKLNVNPCLWCN